MPCDRNGSAAASASSTVSPGMKRRTARRAKGRRGRCSLSHRLRAIQSRMWRTLALSCIVVGVANLPRPAVGQAAADRAAFQTCGEGRDAALPSLVARAGSSYGDGTSGGQFGRAPPLESAQLIRPLGAAFTTGLIGVLAAM